jgi:hypothetical protein
MNAGHDTVVRGDALEVVRGVELDLSTLPPELVVASATFKRPRSTSHYSGEVGLLRVALWPELSDDTAGSETTGRWIVLVDGPSEIGTSGRGTTPLAALTAALERLVRMRNESAALAATVDTLLVAARAAASRRAA